MDIAVIVKFLAPCLPFLLTVGNKAVEGASQKVGEDVWNKDKAIWGKLQPKVAAKAAAIEAAEDVAKNPEKQSYQTALEVQLEKILEADAELAKAIADILQAEIDKPGENIQINTNAYDNATVKVVGKIEAEQVSF
ncbi:MAG: hypothetical protein ACKPCI_08825 [Dolichospermum sp.]